MTKTLREYVKEKGFSDNLVPIYGVFDSFDEIDFEKLPNQFVMKCSHACAFNFICKDKSQINKNELKNNKSEIFNEKKIIPNQKKNLSNFEKIKLEFEE